MSEGHPPTHLGAIDTNLLVALDVLLQERNVTRAAARLGVTQSAMSHKLRRLRDLYDDELLVPSGGGMLTTPRAEALAPMLRGGIAALEEAVTSDDSFDPATATRTNTVITGDYAELVVIPHVVARMAEHAPNVDLVLRPPVDPAGMLTRGDGDVLIGQSIDGASLRTRRLYDEELVCAVRRGHPVLDGKWGQRAFFAHGHVVFSQAGTPTLLDAMLAEQGKSRRRVVTTPHIVGGPFVAARSDLLYTGMRGPVSAAAEHLPLKILPLPFPSPRLTVHMTWHERTNRDAAHRWLREFTAESTLQAVARYGLGPLADRGRQASR